MGGGGVLIKEEGVLCLVSYFSNSNGERLLLQPVALQQQVLVDR